MNLLPFSNLFRRHVQPKGPSHFPSKLNIIIPENMTDMSCIDYISSDSSMNSCALNDSDYSMSDCKMESIPLPSDDSAPIHSIKRNYSVQMSSTPTAADVLMDHDDIKDEDEETSSRSISHSVPHTHTKTSTTLTYDEISKLLGQNTACEDYLATLFEEEDCNNSLSWYTRYEHRKITRHARKVAIEWIRNTSDHLQLKDSTLFRAIYYFDKLCSIKRMNATHLIMVAAVCIFIACKYNQADYDMPQLRQIAQKCNHHYAPDVFFTSEKKILSALDFRLKIILPIDFIQYYVNTKGVIFNDDTCNMNGTICTNLHLNPHLAQDLYRFCVFFLHIASLNYSFWTHKPSMLAIAVICAARRAVKIKPYFNRKLVDTCHYEAQDVNECFNKLWDKYESKFPEKAAFFQSLQPQTLID